NGRKTCFMLLSTFGISIGANIIRNALLAWFHGTGQEENFKLLHDGWGGDLYSVFMLLLILLVFQIMQYREAVRKQSPAQEEVNQDD
ncbi:MAG: archaeosortase/exosortase family protein, partial [Microcystis panniformis]